MTAPAWENVTLGDDLAHRLRVLVVAYEDARDRTQQSAANILGPSQIGDPCTRCLARAFLGRPIVRLFDDPWCRILGTATHAWLAQAAEWGNAQAIAADAPPPFLIEHRVHPDDDLMPNGGSLDLYDAPTKTVIDHKIVGRDRLRHFKTNGPGIAYKRQANVYGWGLILAGVPVEHVAVAFWHRGGRLADLHVWTEPYDEAVVEEALMRAATIRDLARRYGSAILPSLPADPACWDCGGADVTPEELT